MTNKTPYNSDFLLWLQDNISALEAKDYSKVDSTILIEELRKLMLEEKKEFDNCLTLLIANILFCYRSPPYMTTYTRARSSIIDQRLILQSILERSPSLNVDLYARCKEFYPEAVKIAMKLSGLNIFCFPTQLEESLDIILNHDFAHADKFETS